MAILSDEELAAAVQQQPPLVTQVRPEFGRWNSKIQPASLDISIGKIYVPGAEGETPGSDSSPLQSYSLGQGQSAVVESLEMLNVPTNIAGFGFPPASVSMNGLLMTNPGHIDPGYQGVLRFTVINFGKGPIELRAGNPICTLLFLKMASAAQVPFRQLDATDRPGQRNVYPELLQRLSHDFMDFEERAAKKAKIEVDRIDLATKYRQLMWPVVFSVLTVLGAFAVLYFLNPLRTLNDKVIALEAKGTSATSDQVRQLEERIKALEQARGQRP